MKIINDRKMMIKNLNTLDVRRYFSAEFDDDFILMTARQDEEIIRQGEKSEYLYFLISGRCKVSAVMENGRTVIVSNLTAPCLIGEIELINQDVPFSVTCITDALMLALPAERSRNRLLASPHFMYQLCSDLVDKERTNAIRLVHHISFPLENRLAQFILNNSTAEGFAIRKTVIAESLGVSYRHLEKVMSDLVKSGILEKKGKRYRILNRSYLQGLTDVMEVF